MLACFSSDSAATPIHLIPKDQIETWKSEQTDFIQNWLKRSAQKSDSYTLIPSAEGEIECVLFPVKADADFYLAGDLPVQLPPGNYALELTGFPEPDNAALRAQFAISWGLASYRFERYLDKETSEARTLFISDSDELKEYEAFISSIYLTRDLINTPASDMMPENMSAQMSELANEFNAEFSEIVGEQLLAQNYPTIHAVGRASVHPPRLLELRWGADDAPAVTLVGKGVCFDSGGLNLKPGNSMRLMKKDMGGAAHVLGLARLIMATQLPIKLRVLVPAVENAVSGDAFRPGDVITTRKGLSVEIDNTDAEGRLVLCDALTEADAESPELIIDFATLTGACRVALGTELPGFFCNNDDVAHELAQSGYQCKDPVWQLPLHKPYLAMLKSSIADTLNSSPTGLGGAITAALYLERFISDETPWVHFDVMAWNDRNQPGRKIGGEAFGLRATYEMIKQRFSRAG